MLLCDILGQIEISVKGPTDTSQFDDYGEDEDSELFGNERFRNSKPLSKSKLIS